MTKQEMINSIPDLEKRVAFLSDKHYVGCGFHYAMEERLEKLKKQLPKYGEAEDWRDVIIEVAYETFVEDVIDAEETVK